MKNPHVKNIELKVENDRLMKRTEMLEAAIKDIRNLIDDTKGVVTITNKIVPWKEITGPLPRQEYLKRFFEALEYVKNDHYEDI